ncbi:MAG: glucosyltransferase domain-containing protein [Lachnospiraceae bacterium]|nr:glucosyltransferase domain-containing protein [Lachnospiraceae bacterium]
MIFEKKLLQQLKQLDVRYKIAFYSTIIIGLLTHGFSMANIHNNHDNAFNTLHGYGSAVESGRWFLSLLGKLTGGYNLPFVNGAITILLIAFTSSIIVYLYKIQSKLLIVISSGLLVSFPAITASMFYRFTVHFYAVAILFCAISVLLAKQKKIWVKYLSTLFMACSIGVYQAYIPFIAGMLVLLLMVELLEEFNPKKVIADSFIYLSTLVLGFIVYKLMVFVSLQVTGYSLSDYHGIDQMGKMQLSDIPGLIAECYKQMDIIHDNYHVTFESYICKVAFIVAIILGIASIVGILLKKKAKPIVWFGSIVYVAIFPIAVNGIIIICNNSDIRTLMVYSEVLFLIFGIAFFDRLINIIPENRTINYVCPVVWILMAGAIFSYSVQANINYVIMDYTKMQTQSYLTSLVSDIKNVEGYNSGYPIVFVGSSKGGRDVSNILDNSLKNVLGERTRFIFNGNYTEMINTYTRADLLNLYTGFVYNTIDDLKEKRNVVLNPEVIKMRNYPHAGSIKIINKVLVVKCSDIDFDYEMDFYRTKIEEEEEKEGTKETKEDPAIYDKLRKRYEDSLKKPEEITEKTKEDNKSEKKTSKNSVDDKNKKTGESK